MIYLITGVAGFMGSYLAEELISRKHKVIGVDNFFSGHVENLEVLLKNELFEFHTLDASNKYQMFTLLTKREVDVYINMAAACLLYSLHHLLEGFDAEVNLCKVMCEAARGKFVKKIIQFSTSEVYGGSSDEKEFDLDSACFPKTTYAAGKLAADHLLKIYEEKFNIKGFIIRPFNNFGERQENAIIPATIQRILKNERPITQGDGEQSRDFMYVKDTVKIIADILESDENNDVLLATSKKRKIKEIVELIVKKMNYVGDIEYAEERELDVDQLIGKRYNFNYITFDKALENTIKWHKARKEQK